MKDNAIDVEFRPSVRDFLEKQGYTHILSLGIQPNEMNDAAEPETGKENYWLEPIKEDDPRLKYEEVEQTIQAINDTEVFDMATGQDEIRFMIRIPVVDYDIYLKDR